MTEPHPTSDLHDVVHQRHRLGILVVLAEAKKTDFGYLKKTLELTDGNLGRHLQVLEEARLVKIDKTFEQRRPRTWITITTKGRKALETELQALEQLITQARQPRA